MRFCKEKKGFIMFSRMEDVRYPE